MGINRGPNLRRENLIYGIDNGYGIASNDVSTRFAQGKPTTNLAPPSLANWGTENTAERIATGNTYKNQPTFNCRATVGASYQGIDTTITGLRTAAGSNGTVTMSCWIRNNFNAEVPFYAYIGHDFSSTRTIQVNSDWQRLQWTVNQSAMNNDYVELRPYTNDADTYIEMTMPQVEVNVGTATPWTATSRSTTESLIDLKRTTNINTANVSFDSDGIVAFDGTNDIVNTGMFIGRNPHTDPFTIEAIVKSDTTSGARMWLDATNNGTNQRLYCAHAATGTGNPMGIQGTAWDSNGVSDTDFHHYVIVMDGSVAKLYNNGAQHSTRNYTSYVLQQINFGGRGGYYWNGLIPVFKIHNEALSVKQIEDNFNVYKNRFNI